MTCDAPARTEPATAAHPTPPHPKTATESPGPTSPVNMAAPRPAITPQPEQPGRLGPGPGVDLGALARGHQRLLGEGADAEGGGQRGAVGQGHLLGGVVGGEAVPGPSPATRPALAAHRPPVEDDEVARRHRGDVGAHRLHHAGGLVAEQEGEVVVDAPLAVVEVGVADAARLDAHECLAGAGVGDEHGLERDRCALGPGHDAAHLVCHQCSPSSSRFAVPTRQRRPARYRTAPPGARAPTDVRGGAVQVPGSVACHAPSSPGRPAPPW